MENKSEKINMLAYRDVLFDRYLEIYDKYKRWESGEIKLVCDSRSNLKSGRKIIINLIKDHLAEISRELVELDTRLIKRMSPEEIYYRTAEIY